MPDAAATTAAAPDDDNVTPAGDNMGHRRTTIHHDHVVPDAVIDHPAIPIDDDIRLILDDDAAVGHVLRFPHNHTFVSRLNVERSGRAPGPRAARRRRSGRAPGPHTARRSDGRTVSRTIRAGAATVLNSGSAMVQSVEVEPGKAPPIPLEDDQRASVVPTPQIADFIAAFVNDAELVLFLPHRPVR